MAAMETTAFYAFGVPLYVGLMVAEARVARRRQRPSATVAESLGNLSAGLGTIVLGLFLGPALILLYQFGLSHFALVHWNSGAWQPWLLALVLADFGHYWHHRVDHRVAACWAVHGVHHQPEQMNFTVAMRHAWFSDLYSFPFYVPLVVMGVPAEVFFLATTALSVHALITHTELFNFPSFGILVTPRSHTLHHAKNPEYLDHNFGAMLCVWDRLFNTRIDRLEHVTPEYGTVRGYETHDGVKSQWVLFRDLLSLARQATTWRERLKVLFGRPGTKPKGAQEPPLQRVPPASGVSWPVKVWCLGQFAVTLAFALLVCIPRENSSWTFKFITSAVLVASLWTMGGLLDARRYARAQVAVLGVFGSAAVAVTLVLGL